MNGTVHALQRLQRSQPLRSLRPLQPSQPISGLHRDDRPERAEVEAAIRTVIRWAGDDPEREGLIETPARVVRALEEFFSGYAQDPAAMMQKSFEEIVGYDEMVVLCDVRFESHCETHMDPIVGIDAIAYVTGGCVVGICRLHLGE